MRVKFAMSAITIFFVLSIAFIPALILSLVTKVDITTVSSQTYQNTIYCNGEIIEKRVKEIYLEAPVIARQVRVEVGDYVRKGECLVTIDTALTQTVLSQGVTAKNLDSNDAAGIDTSALAKKYGLAESDIQTAMNQYRGAAVQKNETSFIPNEINAPMNGVVTAINLQTDVLTQTTKPVLVVSDNNAYAARVSVNEADVAKVQVGNRAVLSGVGFGERQYSGSVTRIYPTARRIISGTAQQTVVDVELRLDEADELIKPGFSAKAAIVTQEGGEMLTLPYAAILQQTDNREYVFVYRNNHVQKRYIETGLELTDSVEICEGLAAGERVVANPSVIKDENSLVRAVKQGGGAA